MIAASGKQSSTGNARLLSLFQPTAFTGSSSPAVATKREAGGIPHVVWTAADDTV